MAPDRLVKDATHLMVDGGRLVVVELLSSVRRTHLLQD